MTRDIGKIIYVIRVFICLFFPLFPADAVNNRYAETSYAARTISRPPEELHLAPFYRRYVDAEGIPITSSEAVPDTAMLLARDIVIGMLSERPDLRRSMIASEYRVAIMGETESTTDLPEQRFWKKPTRDDPRLTICERKFYDQTIGRQSDREYWNLRARGMGGLLTSGAAENLVGAPGTRYYGENIFVHEFSHAILETIRRADPQLYSRVDRAYRSAMDRGLWKGEYASVNRSEYWAEGTQTWFNSNRIAIIDGRRILSDQDLAAYDPALYNILSEVYGTRHHLPGDVYFEHPARIPLGPLPASTAETC